MPNFYYTLNQMPTHYVHISAQSKEIADDIMLQRFKGTFTYFSEELFEPIKDKYKLFKEFNYVEFEEVKDENNTE